jgi:hypothetical protein
MAFTLSPDILDTWRAYARRCGFPFPDPATDEAVQLARDLVLFALPSLTNDTPADTPSVPEDLACVEHEVANNPHLAAMDWPADFRADLANNVDVFLWVAQEPAYHIPRAVVLAAQRLGWLCKVLTRAEIDILLERVA